MTTCERWATNCRSTGKPGLPLRYTGAASSTGTTVEDTRLAPGSHTQPSGSGYLNPLDMGQELRAVAAIERPRQRAGLRFLTASCTLETIEGVPSLTGKSTVMVEEAEDSSGDSASRQRASKAASAAGDLLEVSRTITQDRLTAYAEASGDDNPLHLDREFAAGTRFGGIIAHGMLTLAFISEMMTAHLGRAWLTGGSLRVRFKGAPTSAIPCRPGAASQSPMMRLSVSM